MNWHFSLFRYIFQALYFRLTFILTSLSWAVKLKVFNFHLHNRKHKELDWLSHRSFHVDPARQAHVEKFRQIWIFPEIYSQQSQDGRRSKSKSFKVTFVSFKILFFITDFVHLPGQLPCTKGAYCSRVFWSKSEVGLQFRIWWDQYHQRIPRQIPKWQGTFSIYSFCNVTILIGFGVTCRFPLLRVTMACVSSKAMPSLTTWPTTSLEGARIP